MDIITRRLPCADLTLARVALPVDRLVLAKRRWRGTAADGREFGFDLAEPLADGDAVLAAAEGFYVLAQRPEPVLEVALETTPAEAARLGWLVGNLHFALETDAGVIRVADDPALRQLFAREHVAFRVGHHVFRPLRGGHAHHPDPHPPSTPPPEPPRPTAPAAPAPAHVHAP